MPVAALLSVGLRGLIWFKGVGHPEREECHHALLFGRGTMLA